MKNSYINEGLKKIAKIFGSLIGIGGLQHGVGEVLQGNVAPKGLVINSWVDGPISWYMGGEPAMTVIPNLLVTGILTIIVSLTLTAYSWKRVESRHSGRNIILLSLIMLLVGGGFGSPILGVMTGLAGTLIHSDLNSWRNRLPESLRGTLADHWGSIFKVCTAVIAVIMIGSFLLPYSGLNSGELCSNSFLLSLGLLPFTIMAAISYDLESREQILEVAILD